MIKTHETDPRCCGTDCPQLIKTKHTGLCHKSVEILNRLESRRPDSKYLRTARCLRRYGV